MKLGDFRKATQHLEDGCEIRVSQNYENVFSNTFTSRVVIINDGLYDDEEKDLPKVIIS